MALMLLMLQVPPVGVLFRVVVAVAQTLNVPVMAVGWGFTDTTVEFEQPLSV